LSSLVIDEVAGCDAKFAGEMGEALVRSFEACPEDFEDLPLVVFDGPR
jgi:hypothetical protein